MYVSEVDGQAFTFQVSGKLWMRSLVMRDIETGSEWAHLLGKAMAGPMKGARLKPIITDMVTWSVWKKQHPDTTVLQLKATSKNYTSQFYDRDPGRFVFGFEVNGITRALPMAELIKRPVHQFKVGSVNLVAAFDGSGTVTHLFDRKVDERVLDFEFDSGLFMTDKQTNSRWDMLSGECTSGELKGRLLKQRVGIMSFRKAWQNFHPESQDVKFP